jgi:hypothetical protein
MLGYEPAEPKLWKAVLGAAMITFPVLYLADVAIVHRQPGWIYVGISCIVSFVLGYQMYSGGPDSLRPIRFWGSWRTGTYAGSDTAWSLVPRTGTETEQQRELDE